MPDSTICAQSQEMHFLYYLTGFSAGVVDIDLLRYLANEIGNEWRHLAHSLGIRRVRLQAILRNNGTNESQQTVYEMLVSWMKKLPRAVNKVK
jgi:Death domain